MGKPYMPLMMGDWIRGTRGMKAEVKGVYIGLLIHQYDQGYLPSDLETLSLIEPEVGKVWVILKDKFEEFEPGKLRNKKLEDVRDFWNKQSNNGKKGGRPKKQNPKINPNNNPKINPKHKPHNDLDYDIDINTELGKGVQGKNNFHDTWQNAFDQIWIEQACLMKFKTLNIPRELEHFRNKCDSAPDDYHSRDKNGLRLAFLHQLKNAKPEKENGTIKIINDKIKLDALIEAKYGSKANTTG